ncbi:MAG TPA: Ig-like domain-containing protein [Terracidiphilus sp.]|jgi:hypothetical protein|nr:Ig-like domain-containing protein [Terracidiphilus sp.]
MSADQEEYNPGAPVTITATFSSSAGNKVLDSDGVAPTGTVTFIADGSNQLGTAAVTGTAGTSTSLASASATLTAKSLSLGGHNITATYSGDGNYAASSSPNSVFLYVDPAPTWMTLTPASGTTKQDQPPKLTASLSTSGTLPAPTGTVSFQLTRNSDYTSAWSASGIQVSNGVTTVTVPANTLPVGTFTLVRITLGTTPTAGHRRSVIWGSPVRAILPRP